MVEVVAVLTRQDAPVGRKKVMTASPVAQIAEAAGITTIKANKINVDVVEQLLEVQAELGVVVAFGSLFNDRALNLFKKGWVNVHYSLLPDWRGAAPVQNALIAGDKVTGVTLFKLDAGMDTGAVYSQVPTVIEPDENAADLLARLTGLGISALNEVLPAIASDIATLSHQIETDSARIAHKPTRDSSRINFNQSAVHIENVVRGSNPEPMAWSELKDEPFRILEARATTSSNAATDSELQKNTGQVWSESGRIMVQCAEGTVLELRVVQPASKKPMAATDWFRGLNEPERVTFK